MYCSKCGNKLNEGEVFCSKCGAATEYNQVCEDKGIVENENKPAGKKIALIIIGILLAVGVVGGIAIMMNNNDAKEAQLPQTKVSEETEGAAGKEKELIDRIYGDYLSAYREYQESGFEEYPYEWDMISAYYPLLLEYEDGYDFELYYAFVDLADDGTPELFISDKTTIYDTATPISDENNDLTYVVDPDGAFLGERAFCDICEDYYVRDSGTGGASYNYVTYSKIGKDTCKPESGYGAEMDGEKCYSLKYDKESQKYIKEKEISIEKYWEICDDYKVLEGITWHKLSEYKSETDIFLDEITMHVEKLNSCYIEYYDCEMNWDEGGYAALYETIEGTESLDAPDKIVPHPENVDYSVEHPMVDGYYIAQGYSLFPVNNFNSVNAIKQNMLKYVSEPIFDKVYRDNFIDVDGTVYYRAEERGYGAVTLVPDSVVFKETIDEKRYVFVDANYFNEYDHVETIEFTNVDGEWLITDIWDDSL